ncbi:DUF3833 family protein [Allosphingosinicella sp.]|uniref:DUF3833 family protein n=1 Tax=Allosphingosinicella sp. TaxID=2823234 RepID=UPI00378513FD
MPASAFLSFLLLQAAAGQGIEQFFVGRTVSTGSANILMQGTRAVRDQGRGRIERGNILVLEQTVEEEGKPPRARTWRLLRTRDNRITGTITGARGPVSGTVSGNMIHLSYQSEDGPAVEQWIAIDPSRRVARNHMVFSRMGVAVATVDTVIRRLD